MGNFWLKLKIWTKTTLFAVLVIYLLFFLYNNSGETVKFWWWFGHEEEHGKLTFAFAAFLAGVILTILLRTTFATMNQVRDLKARSRNQRMEKDIQDMKDKAARLQTRPAPAAIAAPISTPVPGGFQIADPPADKNR
jgi:lysylphosphatidylglycerol synthetase-like protein (DUF2156 family)